MSDVLRFAVFVLYGVLITLTTQLMVCYRQAKRNARDGKGLLTRHVMTICASYLVFATESLYENLVRLGDPFTAYIPVNAAAVLFGIYALSEMLKFQRTRVKP